jgi:hypothetical protein
MFKLVKYITAYHPPSQTRRGGGFSTMLEAACSYHRLVCKIMKVIKANVSVAKATFQVTGKKYTKSSHLNLKLINISDNI